MMPYELLCCFRYSNEPEGTLPPAVNTVLAAIQKHNGSVTGQEDRGVQRLCYPINHQNSGHYVLFQLTMEQNAVAPLEALLTVEPALLRHQLLRYVKTQSPRPMMQRPKKPEETSVPPVVTAATPEQPRPAAISAEELDKSIERILEEKVL